MWYNISIHTTVTVLLTEVNGEEKEYRILFTDIADTEFIEAITNYVTQLTDKEINGILLENSISYPKENFWLLLVKGFAFIILLITVLVLILVIHRKKKELKMTLEVDSLTETTNIAGLESVYRQIINRHNYVLYQAIYFRIELHKLSEKCTRKEIEDVLKGTASILKAHEYSSDVFIRAKDDGFLMLKMCVNDIELEKYVDMVIDNVHALISAYANTSTDYCYAGVYKISSFSEHIKDIAHLAEQTCMFAAKRNLRIAYFSQGLISSLKEEKELLNSIEDAIKQEEIKLYLHFFVDPRTDTIVGAEALSRWHHTIKGVLLPDKFIHVLEREGKAPVLDYYILGKTCALLEKLYSQGIDDFFVSFNLSRATLESDGFVQIVKSIINNYNFRHDSLILELTESFLQRDIELIYENLSEIKKRRSAHSYR